MAAAGEAAASLVATQVSVSPQFALVVKQVTTASWNAPDIVAVASVQVVRRPVAHASLRPSGVSAQRWSKTIIAMHASLPKAGVAPCVSAEASVSFATVGVECPPQATKKNRSDEAGKT